MFLTYYSINQNTVFICKTAHLLEQTVYVYIFKLFIEAQHTFKEVRKSGASGWLSQLSIRVLVSAQVTILRAVRGFGPCVWFCADSAEPAWDFLSVCLSLSLRINKH